MSTPTIETPLHGVHDGMSAEEYHAHPALSSSGARALMPPSCPAKFEYLREHPVRKRVFDQGALAHRLVLGAGQEIVVVDAADWRTKAAREAKAEAHERDAVPVLAAEYERAEEMAAVVHGHDIAGGLIGPGAPGRAEVSLFWRDVVSGVQCRARVDHLPPTPESGRLILPDYKSAASSEPSKVERAIIDWGYHMQFDWYGEGVMELGLADVVIPTLIAQEKEPPYVVTVMQISGTSLWWAGVLNAKARAVFAECTRLNHWPGYLGESEVAMATLPPYVERQYEEARERGEYDTETRSSAA